MTDSDLDSMREALFREPSYPDLSGELASARAECDNLRHEVMKLRFENSGLYRKLELLREERMEGTGTSPEVAFVLTAQSDTYLNKERE